METFTADDWAPQGHSACDRGTIIQFVVTGLGGANRRVGEAFVMRRRGGFEGGVGHPELTLSAVSPPNTTAYLTVTLEPTGQPRGRSDAWESGEVVSGLCAKREF